MDLPAGVSGHKVATSRLRMRYIESGPPGGVPIVLIHGNLSTGRFFEHLMPGAPATYRLIAPDMRGFKDTERLPIDATRGFRDWADDASNRGRRHVGRLAPLAAQRDELLLLGGRVSIPEGARGHAGR